MKTFIVLVLVVVLAAGGYVLVKSGRKIPDVAGLKVIAQMGPKVDAATGKPVIKCPRCGGTGIVKCPNPKCKDGTIECNGPCLRLSKGLWIKKDVAGHPPTDVWQEFPYSEGSQFWSQAHVGQVVEMVNGKPTITGVCKICNGTTRVPDPVCKGTGEVTCPLCRGAKEIPDPKVVSTKKPEGEAKLPPLAAVPAPTSAPRVETIRLKNGKTVVGQVVIRGVDSMVIRTADGKSVQVDTKDVVRGR